MISDFRFPIIRILKVWLMSLMGDRYLVSQVVRLREELVLAHGHHLSGPGEEHQQEGEQRDDKDAVT